MLTLGPFKYIFDKKSLRALSLNQEMTFYRGEKVAIVGPSGGGKTTLLKIIKGIIPTIEMRGEFVTSGARLINDKNLGGENFNLQLQQLVYLFQNPYSQLIHTKTEEEFLLSMENFEFEKNKIEEIVEQFSNNLELELLWGKKTYQLSNGECQKLVLSSLVAVNPQVILLDEPTAFIDPESRKKIYDFIFLNPINKDKTVFLVDHYCEEIAHLVDRVVLVDHNGSILELSRDVHGKFLSNKSLRSESKIAFNFNFLNHFQKMSLVASQINFSYQKNRVLLKNVDIAIRSGDILAIKGKNGAGKSTLIKILSGMLCPDSGSVKLTINEKIIYGKKLPDQIGFIFQNPENHFVYDTIREEVDQCEKFQFENAKSNLKEILIASLIPKVDLEKSPFLLSEGEKRRLTVLMTLLLGKKIIFYDEPTFGQDQEMIETMTSLILELKKYGFIQVIISHDDNFIKALSANTYELRDGKIYEKLN